MRAKEAPRFVDRLLTLAENPGVELPDVGQPGPRLEFHRDIVERGAAREPHRIVEQCLGGANVNEERRQAAKVGMDRDA